MLNNSFLSSAFPCEEWLYHLVRWSAEALVKNYTTCVFWSKQILVYLVLSYLIYKMGNNAWLI